MVGKGTLAILLLSAPYGNQYADHMCRVAMRALEKGYSVEIFLYGDAVLVQMSHQSPEGLFPVGPRIVELIEKGARVYSCQTCSEARGNFTDPKEPSKEREDPVGKVAEGIHITSIDGFVEMLARADKALSFGGG
ncbi:MAG TPA: DsrE family protein [Methanomassiliicoccales archaeon]|jgi:sulfur relay (sulfurtransferase) complex TusBCD TusD component (DsrE family)